VSVIDRAPPYRRLLGHAWAGGLQSTQGARAGVGVGITRDPLYVLGDDDWRAGPPLRCAPMTHDPTHDAEMDAIVAELEAAVCVPVAV